MMNQPQDITPQMFSQNVGQLKRRLAQANGEASMLQNDTQNQFIEQILQMVNLIFAQSNAKDVKLADIQDKLDKCYNAHPELKITEEAASKEAAAKAKKGTAKKV